MRRAINIILALLLTAGGVTTVAMLTGAAVEPETIEGNTTCAEQGYAFGLRIEGDYNQTLAFSEAQASGDTPLPH